MSTARPQFEVTTSRQFSAWLAEQRASLAFTTYQAGKLFLIGLQPNGRLSIFERTFNRCLGLWSDGLTIWLSSLFQLRRFENVLEPGQLANGLDRLYVPQVGYVMGDLDIHDVAVDGECRPVFINTLFGCLATTSETHSFVPLWKPPFTTKLAAEDRCHLNGLAMEDGRPRYVTTVSQSDVADGWRDRRRDGGLVIDVTSDATVCANLSMPQSPRLASDRLSVLNSGAGFFGQVNPEKRDFEAICFCPGYLRGLAFVGKYAVVGLSMPRENRTFSGLQLDDELSRRDAEPRCGLYVIDLSAKEL